MLTTIITHVLGAAFAVSSLVGFVLAAGERRLALDDTDVAICLSVGAMFGWAAIAMLWGVGV